ncbi:MAG: protein translocase subunit SecF [Chloroflexota bacterium]
MDIIGKRYWFFLLSAIIILPGLISLCIAPGLRLAVDFTGGTLWEMEFAGPVQPAEIRMIMADHGFSDSIVQTSGTNTVLVRSKEIQAGSAVKSEIEDDIRAKFGPFTERQFASVGPAIGAEVAERAILAVALASLGILGYITYAFRKVPSAFRYGACAVIALVHDAVLVLGVFSILGKLFDVEIDSLFVTALLTVIGFSVHDTIVVFDRIRENMGRLAGLPFEAVVNHSILQTLGRSITTSLTVVLTLAALVLFGGVTIRLFALTLLIGIITGTYSSIFNASALLVVWENKEIGRFFQRWRAARAGANPTGG